MPPPVRPGRRPVVQPQPRPRPTPVRPPASNPTPTPVARPTGDVVENPRPRIPGGLSPVDRPGSIPVVPGGPIPAKATEVNAQGVKTYRFSGPGPTGAGKATINWEAPRTNTDGSPLTDLGGFKVYFGSEPGKFTHVVDVGNVTAFEVTGLPPGMFYATATAYDTEGNESTLSNEGSKLIK